MAFINVTLTLKSVNRCQPTIKNMLVAQQLSGHPTTLLIVPGQSSVHFPGGKFSKKRRKISPKPFLCLFLLEMSRNSCVFVAKKKRTGFDIKDSNKAVLSSVITKLLVYPTLRMTLGELNACFLCDTFPATLFFSCSGDTFI